MQQKIGYKEFIYAVQGSVYYLQTKKLQFSYKFYHHTRKHVHGTTKHGGFKFIKRNCSKEIILFI
jgi:hypothetical protein